MAQTLLCVHSLSGYKFVFFWKTKACLFLSYPDVCHERANTSTAISPLSSLLNFLAVWHCWCCFLSSLSLTNILRVACCPCAASEIHNPFSHPHSRHLYSPGNSHLFENCHYCCSFKFQISPVQDFCFISEMIATVKGSFPWWLNWVNWAGIARDLFNHLCQQNVLQQMLPLWDERFTWTLLWLSSSDLWRSGPLWSAVKLWARFIFCTVGLCVQCEEQLCMLQWEQRPGLYLDESSLVIPVLWDP